MNPEVESQLQNAKLWKEELLSIRQVLLDCPLEEEMKWKKPCYTYQGKNIVGLVGFKDAPALVFYKGALLQDADGLLKKPGEHTQEGRVLRFKGIDEILALEKTIKAYVFEAIEVEKAGIKLPDSEKKQLEFPDELKNRFDADEKLKEAFEALTPGRQRAYLIHFTGSKQSKTREARIDKYADRILKGYGFHDCVCGLSKRMPTCDGSHKYA